MNSNEHLLNPLQAKFKVRIRQNGLSSLKQSKQANVDSLYDLCLNSDLKLYGQRMNEFDDVIDIRDEQIQG